MKVLFQLLKEFWLPFFISVSWTIYSKWGVKFDFVGYMSTLGPAFFLVSWVVGQVFRVRKQVGVESSFGNVERRLQDLAESLEQNVAKMVGHINGGDSFCYLMPNGGSGGQFVLRHCGEYPLFKLHIRIADIGALRQGGMLEQQFAYEEFAVNSFAMLDTPQFSDSQALNIFYNSRSGKVVQQIRFVKVNGHSGYAYRITRDAELLVQYLPENFPLDEEDKKSWLGEFGLKGNKASWTTEHILSEALKHQLVS
ncbi:hypothetical protein [Pseudomonas sp. NFX15]|uniref:hypothetical protein n=1 Tax=Pseudomonas sp. NFX15 TaxID=2816958 RepID=UPI003B8D8851